MKSASLTPSSIFTLSAGWVIREQVFFNRAEALEAAGLSE
jgi:hypothetical protein